jgi:hypothetical protein
MFLSRIDFLPFPHWLIPKSCEGPQKKVARATYSLQVVDPCSTSKIKPKNSYKHMVVTALLARTGSIRKTNETSHILGTNLFITFQHTSILMFTKVAENALR